MPPDVVSGIFKVQTRKVLLGFSFVKSNLVGNSRSNYGLGFMIKFLILETLGKMT